MNNNTFNNVLDAYNDLNRKLRPADSFDNYGKFADIFDMVCRDFGLRGQDQFLDEMDRRGLNA